ncbi:MAG: phenylacetate-CoA oxygenase subunit PaaC [Bacteroidetes bacterium]|jgi:ring-1,2-phenylacetyl-CoA epoxidase subunit PaaC|nr:phenylacetate-CoA oxygenase subunit PaaC [Bacteroidota bacterium]
MTLNAALYNFCLRIADNNMILGQRLAEWCSKGPILEEDIALTNLSLDLFGEAESFYEYAAALDNHTKTADDIAFLRNERQYFNFLIVEQPNGDFAFTMMKQLLYACYARLLYSRLSDSKDERISGLSAKAVKEMRYHFRHSAEWIIRLGQGTELSKHKVQFALDELWRFTDDMFEMNETDEVLIEAGMSFNIKELYAEWREQVGDIFSQASLEIPEYHFDIKGGINGIHTEHLGHILCEMQYLQRAHPGATW